MVCEGEGGSADVKMRTGASVTQGAAKAVASTSTAAVTGVSDR